MRILGPSDVNGRDSRQIAVARSSSQKGSGQVPSSGSARSSAAQAGVVVAPTLNQASTHAERSAAERELRVERVIREIKDGSYRVDKDQLAVRMLDEELARAGER